MKNAVRHEAALPQCSPCFRSGSKHRISPGEQREFAVDVIYTTEAGTQEALKAAWALAHGLRANVRLIFICPVPYSLPLTSPPVALDFLQDKLAGMAGSSGGETSVHIYLCREPLWILGDVLREPSLVVLGGRTRWWLTRERRLERQLKRAGCEVIFVESK